MNKSGEVERVAQSHLDRAESGILDGVSQRPRCIFIGGEPTNGVQVMIMHSWWDNIKNILYPFVHGYPHDLLTARYSNYIKSGFHSASLDGSAWDSTQNPARLRAVCTRLYPMLLTLQRPAIEEFLAKNNASISVEQFENIILQTGLVNDNTVFVRIPDINGPAWTPEVISLFERNFPNETKFRK